MLTPISMSIMLVAQVLLGGSTGADGPFNPTADQTVLTVPDGGRFNFTTVNIPRNVTVSFTRNAKNDPVMFLATGDIVVAGWIAVDGEAGQTNRGGRGGPGGYDGGDPGFGAAAGAGHGPGGGVYSATETYRLGAGAHSTAARDSLAQTYGSKLCMPLVGGSGGSGGPALAGGGGGGGAILIASETSISIPSNGAVFARGGNYTDNGGYSGGGSGGCIRLVSPRVSLNGTASANGSVYGEAGYLRIDAIDKSGIFGYRIPGAPPGFSMGSNMVVELTPMPSVALVSAAGIATNGQPLFHTLPPGSVPTQPVVFTTNDFVGGCATVTVRVVPASGPAVESGVNVGFNGVHTVDVTIPPNIATAIEVYGKVAACPA